MCVTFSDDFFHCSPRRSPGEQVQYKACSGHHCCAVSGLLHHTGNDIEGIRKSPRWFGYTLVGKLGFSMQWQWLCSRERLRSCTQTVTCLLKTSTFTVMEDDTFGWPVPVSSSWSVACNLVCWHVWFSLTFDYFLLGVFLYCHLAKNSSEREDISSMWVLGFRLGLVFTFDPFSAPL